jgi:hypothetical protein
MQHHLLIISNLFSMLANINIKQKKTTKSGQKRTYFFISNVYLEQPLSFGFYLENFTSHKLEKS